MEKKRGTQREKIVYSKRRESSSHERPPPLAYSGTANREVAHLGLSTNRIARYPHMALNHLHRLCSPDDYVISCLLPATPSILL
ncbi:hypothetical protein TNIN_19441 [Trichonephila inaurata madagascariensis]|uniref:Uncharacterized protein n=1 Tax=Trichonephila inaurata madagascariensis TaxID=2747483 RepID=A0A8X6IFR0_9ARAC|nr:hypothetical protein TNIN_19441 [Trichonephila inaurata madagascariensis]